MMSVKGFEQIDRVLFRLLFDAVRDEIKARRLTDALLDRVISDLKEHQKAIRREPTMDEVAGILGDALLELAPHPQEQYSVIRVELDPDDIAPPQTYLDPQLYKTKKDALDDIYNQLECQYGPGLQNCMIETDDIGDYDLLVSEHFQDDDSWRTMTLFRVVTMKG